MLLHDERTAQRDHHQYAKDAAGEREHRDLDVVEIAGTVGHQENQRGNREDDTTGQ
jgi:hypothetical protein